MERLTPQAQRVLLRAAELINVKEMWIKGSYHNGYANEGTDNEVLIKGSYCAIGAVQTALLENGLDMHEGKVRERVINKLIRNLPADSIQKQVMINEYDVSVEGFNDDPSTTHADVKDLFCRTVKEEVEDVDGRD